MQCYRLESLLVKKIDRDSYSSYAFSGIQALKTANEPEDRSVVSSDSVWTGHCGAWRRDCAAFDALGDDRSSRTPATRVGRPSPCRKGRDPWCHRPRPFGGHFDVAIGSGGFRGTRRLGTGPTVARPAPPFSNPSTVGARAPKYSMSFEKKTKEYVVHRHVGVLEADCSRRSICGASRLARSTADPLVLTTLAHRGTSGR